MEQTELLISMLLQSRVRRVDVQVSAIMLTPVSAPKLVCKFRFKMLLELH